MDPVGSGRIHFNFWDPVPAGTGSQILDPVHLEKFFFTKIQILRQDPVVFPEFGQGIHAVSRLIQITQQQQKKEPVYTLVAEKGMPRRREFTVQVKFAFLELTFVF